MVMQSNNMKWALIITIEHPINKIDISACIISLQWKLLQPIFCVQYNETVVTLATQKYK